MHQIGGRVAIVANYIDSSPPNTIKYVCMCACNFLYRLCHRLMSNILLPTPSQSTHFEHSENM